MKSVKQILSAIFAGIMISIGGCVFLVAESKLAGSLLFATGLTTILIFGFLLFTGKTAYLMENNLSYLGYLFKIWVGNLIGCAGIGVLIKFARPNIAEAAQKICELKLEQAWWQTILLGALCGILVYIAVDYFKSDKDQKPLPKYILTFCCISIFILCGFEHSVADMFYFAAAGLFSLRSFVYIFLVVLGNTLGGLCIPAVQAMKGEQNA